MKAKKFLFCSLFLALVTTTASGFERTVSGKGGEHPADYVPVLLSNGRLTLLVDETLSVPERLKYWKCDYGNSIYREGRRLVEPGWQQTPQGRFVTRVTVGGKDPGAPLEWSQTLDPRTAETRIRRAYADGTVLEGSAFAADGENLVVVTLKATGPGTPEASLDWIAPRNERIVATGERTFRTYGRKVVDSAVEIVRTEEDGLTVYYLAFADSMDSAAESPAERAQALAAAAAGRGLGAVRAKHRAAWAAYYAESDFPVADERFARAKEMAEYQLRCNVTEHSIPVGMTPGMWEGKIFAFDEMYAVQGLLAAGHHSSARAATDFRRATLQQAHARCYCWDWRNRRDDGVSVGSRWYWEEMQDNAAEGAAGGMWLDHIFHMSAIARSAYLQYRYTGDLDYLAESSAPVIFECARFFRWQYLYDVDGSPYVGKCTDLERLGPGRERAFMTTIGVINTFLSAAETAERLRSAGRAIPKEIAAATDAEIAEWRRLAAALEGSLEVKDGRFTPYPGCPELSMGTLAGFFPFPVFPKDHAVQYATVEHFLHHGENVGNMYAEGKRVCPWYAATMSSAAGYAGMSDEQRRWVEKGIESCGCWGEFWEINEPGTVQRRPWFMTAAGNMLYAICRLCGKGGDYRPGAAETDASGGDWVRFDLTRDIVPGSAFDFSARLDAPAGKYGWLRAVGDHFEFEKLPGVPQRFYGINLCMGLNVPDSHADSDRLIDRLAAAGYNSLRIHHYDAYCVGWKSGCGLDAGEMDKFDYLYARAITKGLYLTTDLFVSRRVAWREIGEDRDGFIDANTFKALTLFHPGAIENWQRFAANFMNHVNPYTGRAYKDEPAMPLVCTVNEGWMLGGWFAVRERPEVVAAYDAWRRDKIAEFGEDFMRHSCATNVTGANCYGWKNAATSLFLAEFQERGHARQVEFLRSIGVKALLSAGNHGPNNAPNGRLRARALDYVDTHCYVDHPHHLNSTNRWGLPSWCANVNPVSGVDQGRMDGLAWARVADRPFTVTEWNFSGPGEYRGIAGLYGGSMMARQDWSGVWRFAYGHDRSVIADVPGANEVPGYFNTANDPIMTASERLVMNLFLRRDMRPIAERLNLVIDAKSLMPDGDRKGEWESRSIAPVKSDPVWARRCSNSLKEVPGADNRPLSDWARRAGAREDAICGGTAADGVVTIEREKGVFTVSTPCTCGVFGDAGEYQAGAFGVRIAGGTATVSVTSLDGLPVTESAHLLVSHLTDCRGLGASSHFDEKGRYVTDSFGKGGMEVRDGKASVTLKNSGAGWKVYALAASGRRRFEVPAVLSDGTLAFEASVKGADGSGVIEYELVR